MKNPEDFIMQINKQTSFLKLADQIRPAISYTQSSVISAAIQYAEECKKLTASLSQSFERFDYPKPVIQQQLNTCIHETIEALRTSSSDYQKIYSNLAASLAPFQEALSQLPEIDPLFQCSGLRNILQNIPDIPNLQNLFSPAWNNLVEQISVQDDYVLFPDELVPEDFPSESSSGNAEAKISTLKKLSRPVAKKLLGILSTLILGVISNVLSSLLTAQSQRSTSADLVDITRAQDQIAIYLEIHQYLITLDASMTDLPDDLVFGSNPEHIQFVRPATDSNTVRIQAEHSINAAALENIDTDDTSEKNGGI